MAISFAVAWSLSTKNRLEQLGSSIPERKQRMASLILKMSVSLDGYVAPPDGSSDWATAGRSEDGAAWTLETVSNAGTHLIGAATYAHWATFWPGASGPFAKPMNDIPKVVSRTHSRPPTGPDDSCHRRTGRSRHAAQAGALRRYLLAQGGTRFARSLVATGLIDEYPLVVHPVVLGAGDRLFDTPLSIKPISTTAFSRGAVATSSLRTRDRADRQPGAKPFVSSRANDATGSPLASSRSKARQGSHPTKSPTASCTTSPCFGPGFLRPPYLTRSAYAGPARSCSPTRSSPGRPLRL